MVAWALLSAGVAAAPQDAELLLRAPAGPSGGRIRLAASSVRSGVIRN
jgi:hypothetical protein